VCRCGWSETLKHRLLKYLLKKKLLILSKINATLGSACKSINVRCKMTKLALVFYEKDLDMNLSFV
jgi:hypothetical protein